MVSTVEPEWWSLPPILFFPVCESPSHEENGKSGSFPIWLYATLQQTVFCDACLFVMILVESEACCMFVCFTAVPGCHTGRSGDRRFDNEKVSHSVFCRQKAATGYVIAGVCRPRLWKWRWIPSKTVRNRLPCSFYEYVIHEYVPEGDTRAMTVVDVDVCWRCIQLWCGAVRTPSGWGLIRMGLSRRS